MTAQPRTDRRIPGRLPWGRIGRWAMGLGVAGLSAWLLVRDLDWQALRQVLGQANYLWVALGVLAIVGTFFSRVWRWQALLEVPGATPDRPLPPSTSPNHDARASRRRGAPAAPCSLRWMMTALLAGQVVNLALPMRSGDVLRAVWLGRGGAVGPAQALGSIVVEKVWDLVALLGCGLVLLAWMPLPQWFRDSLWGTALAVVAGLALLWAVMRWREGLFRLAGRLLGRLPAGWDRALLPLLHQVSTGLASLRQPRSSLRALMWTVLTWALGALANWAVLAAFGLFSPAAAFLLLATLMVGSAVPTPGKLGVFEGITVISLGLLGSPRSQALAVGLVLHIVVVGPALLAAAGLVLWPERPEHRAKGRDLLQHIPCEER